MRDLDAVLRRGSVFHWDSYAHLDEPGAAPKGKFLLVINAFLPDDPLYYLLTTSKVEALANGPFRDDVVVFEAGSYAFFDRRTAMNVGTAGDKAPVPAETFRGMYYDREIEWVGQLSDDDIGRIDKAVLGSVRVAKDLKRFITAW